MGFIKDLLNELVGFELFPADSKTATANGTGVNVSDYTGVLRAILSSEAGTGTTPTLDVKIQDSADNSTFADLSPAKAFTQVTDAAAAFESIAIDTRAVRKFIRAVVTITGASAAFVFSVNVVGQKHTA